LETVAPEVALGKPYNESVDVYSYSLLLWQILKLATPYNGFNSSQLKKGVYQGNVRPKMDLTWPRRIRTTMKFGWGGPSDRPSMAEMALILRIECGLEDPSNFSSHNPANEFTRSLSLMSAVDLGYDARNTTPTVETYNTARKKGRRSPMNDVAEETVGDGDEEEHAGREDDQMLAYSTVEESDRPIVSFIAAADLPLLLATATPPTMMMMTT
jgi:Protein tyrosine and serine/threonine kinase